MKPRLKARITEAGHIACHLSSTHSLPLTRLCFSLIDPAHIVEGAGLVRRVGAFMEIELGDLMPKETCTFTLAYDNGKAHNRAWLPMGVYARDCNGDLVDVEGPAHDPTALEPGQTSTPEPGALGLIPVPFRWRAYGGSAVFTGLKVASVSFPDSVTGACALARRLGLPPLILPDDDRAGTLCDLKARPERGPESYAINHDAASGRLTIEAADAAGAFYACVSLIYLRAVHAGDLPYGLVEDRPRFSWRGQHLDCARHAFKTETLHRLMDLMALLKLNRFHWHFSDDEAFRLEVACAPDIWQKSAFRGEAQLIPGVFGGGAGPTGGTYSRQDVNRLLERARNLHIEVMPEIEFPAHSYALTRLRPNLRDDRETFAEVSVQGYEGNVVNPALEATWDFIGPLVDEVGSLFPFSHLHLGGDELPKTTWKGSPRAEALKRREGLKTTQDLLGFALRKLAGRVRDRGRVPCAWHEGAAYGCNGGIGHDALLFAWSGIDAALAAAKRGCRLVMCPASHTYLDMAPSAARDDWGAAWAAFIGLGDTLAWDPSPIDMPSDLKKKIIGVQGAYWSEFTTRDEQIEPMLVPRILGIATQAWSPRAAIDPEGLSRQAHAALRLFSAFGWRVGPIYRQASLPSARRSAKARGA